MAEEIIYREHRLIVSPHGSGWKVLIYPSGSRFAHAEIPNTSDRGSRDDVIAQARRIVDGLISSGAKL